MHSFLFVPNRERLASHRLVLRMVSTTKPGRSHVSGPSRTFERSEPVLLSPWNLRSQWSEINAQRDWSGQRPTPNVNPQKEPPKRVFHQLLAVRGRHRPSQAAGHGRLVPVPHFFSMTSLCALWLGTGDQCGDRSVHQLTELGFEEPTEYLEGPGMETQFHPCEVLDLEVRHCRLGWRRSSWSTDSTDFLPPRLAGPEGVPWSGHTPAGRGEPQFRGSMQALRVQ